MKLAQFLDLANRMVAGQKITCGCGSEFRREHAGWHFTPPPNELAACPECVCQCALLSRLEEFATLKPQTILPNYRSARRRARRTNAQVS